MDLGPFGVFSASLGRVLERVAVFTLRWVEHCSSAGALSESVPWNDTNSLNRPCEVPSFDFSPNSVEVGLFELISFGFFTLVHLPLNNTSSLLGVSWDNAVNNKACSPHSKSGPWPFALALKAAFLSAPLPFDVGSPVTWRGDQRDRSSPPCQRLKHMVSTAAGNETNQLQRFQLAVSGWKPALLRKGCV